MPVKRSSLTPTYGWDKPSNRYRSLSSGQFVSRDKVRAALDLALTRSQLEVTRVSRSLVAGQVDLKTWQLSVARELKVMHMASAALAKGGWAQMTQADFGRTGAALRQEYGHLARFASQLSSGAQPLNGAFFNRVNQYAQGPRETYHRIEQETMRESGFTEYRNVLGQSEHCAQCKEQTERGYVRIGQLVPVGQRTCRHLCKCVLQYRKGATAERLVG